MSRDWDLFSAAGAPAALLASILWLRHANDRSAAARVAALCVAWFAPFVALHAGTRTERREFATMAVSLVGSPLGGDAASAARGPAAAAWDARIRELDTTGAAAAIDEGDALAVAGRTDDARRAYERALAAEPDNHAARLCLGQLAYRDGRRDDAARLLRAIPDDARDRIVASARMVLGQIALDAGDAAAAARLLDEAIRGASWLPKAPAAARLYAEACRRLGRADDAVAAERWADRRAPR